MHRSNHDNDEQDAMGQDALRDIELLGKQPSELDQSSTVDDRRTAALGQAIRESADKALPAPSDSLRDALVQHLDSNTQVAELGSSRRYLYGIIAAVAASLLVVIGYAPIAGLLNDERTQEVAVVNPLPTTASANTPVAAPVAENAPGNQNVTSQPAEPIQYRTEIRTREVPVTVMRTQTKTRAVPVTKTRQETRTRMVDVDGKQVQQQYQVSVPYTENVSQSYTVQVPVTSTRTETYEVQVPVTSSNTDSYSVRVPTTKFAELKRASSGGLPSEPVPVSDSPSNSKPREYSIPTSENRSPANASPSGAWATQVNRTRLESLPPSVLREADGEGRPTYYSGHAFMFSDFDSTILEAELAEAELAEAKFAKAEAGAYKKLKEAKPYYEQNMGAWRYRVVPNPERLRNAEQYAPIIESKFISPKGKNALSTFSIDVDTASYANTRRFLSDGRLPPPNAVRVEEFLNYFSYDYPQPDNDDPFSVNMEVAACPWRTKHKLLRIGLKGKEIKQDKRPASNLVFLLDVSGSMRQPDKLPLMQRGLGMMVKQLREDDFVSIVTYAGEAGVALPPTSGDQTRRITDTIDSLSAGGSTNGSAGIDRAYELAAENFVKDGTNRVILATDGDLNVGITKDDELTKLIQSKAGEGVFLTVLGFGTGNLKDAKMEKLADNGNGVYAYIDSVREARKVLVNQMSGNLVTIAKDVKLQVEFNPKFVSSYRLIGYENRALANKDFANDKKDAGEIGAGHTVTALYELAGNGAGAESGSAPDVPVKLKYQDATSETVPKQAEAKLSDAGESDELLTLALRYKQPDETKSKRIEFVCENSDAKFEAASEDFRFAASVAAFALKLRGSKYAGEADYAFCESIASESLGADTQGLRSEFVDLVRKADELSK